jgi:hypothetical protein
MRRITVNHHATITTVIEVPDDATREQITEAVVEEVPKYPTVKAGENFDPEDFTILEDETAETWSCGFCDAPTPVGERVCARCKREVIPRV